MKPGRRKTAAVAACLLATGIVAAFSVSALWAGDREARPEVSSLPAPIPEKRPVDEGRASLKVMTLNVAHGRKDGPNQLLQRGGAIRSNLDDIAAVLRRERPHVVALQEADGPSFWSGRFNHVEYLAEKAELPHSARGEHVRSKKLSYGTAVLSALELRDPLSITFAPSPPTFTKGLVACTVDWPGGLVEVDVVSVHLDFSRNSVRQKQAEEAVGRLSGREGPLIVMGDFNCEWTSKESTLRTMAKGLSLRAHRPEAAGMDTFAPLKRRLDWILISPELEFATYEVLPDVLSDHFAVVSELRMVENAPAQKTDP